METDSELLLHKLLASLNLLSLLSSIITVVLEDLLNMMDESGLWRLGDVMWQHNVMSLFCHVCIGMVLQDPFFVDMAFVISCKLHVRSILISNLGCSIILDSEGSPSARQCQAPASEIVRSLYRSSGGLLPAVVRRHCLEGGRGPVAAGRVSDT